MPAQALIDAHRTAQDAARAVLGELAVSIGPADTEKSIATRATRALFEHGIRETWYYECPALVLLGSPRSCASASGREYRPGSEPVGQTNLVTVDLSPSYLGHWGDCARSFPVEEGRVTFNPRCQSLAGGIAFLQELHSAMRRFVRPQTTFHELAVWTARRISAAGFVNLDFRGNVGHSIGMRREDRVYIEEGNGLALGEVGFFTFEPHVRAGGEGWGFKHEDVFFFGADGLVNEL